MTRYHQNQPDDEDFFTHFHPFLEESRVFIRDHPFFHHNPFFSAPDDHNPRFRGRGGRIMRKALDVLKKLAFVLLVSFLISSVFRLFVLMLSFIFAPPVLFLSLILLVLISHDSSGHNYTFETTFNPNRLRVVCLGPGYNDQLRRFFGTSNGNNRGRRQDQTARGNGSERTNLPENQANQNAPRPTIETSSDVSSNEESSMPRHALRQPRAHYPRVWFHRDENNDQLLLALDVPGFGLDDLNVSMEDSSTLIVQGSRTNRFGETFYIEERFTLDQEKYNLDSVQGNLVDGVLEITVQKKPAPQPRIISITTNKKSD